MLTSARITFHRDVVVGDLPDATEQALCWVAKEAVTNALRHSAPRSVTLTVGSTAAQTEMTVINDGVLPSTSDRPGNGLAGLGERLAEVGGVVISERTADGSFALHARIPFLQEPSSSDRPHRARR